jgi:glycine/D-amino acid oxidase-like deaminating enzyme
MVDVAIIGAGFWGSAIARLLVERGIEHIVIDDGAPTGASRAAAGICKMSWYRQDTVTKMINGVFTYGEVASGFEWLGQQVKIEDVPETFVNVGRGTTREHLGNYLADPRDLLVPALDAEVTRLWPRNSVNIVGPNLDLFAREVVVCAGARTDDVLEASDLGRMTGVQGLWGRAIRFDCEGYERTPECQTFMTRPYVHYTFRHLDGRIRGGDTVERKRSDKRMDELIALAVNNYGAISEMEVFGGIRPVCKQMFVGRVHPHVIAATGGHRVGFGIAGAVAHRVVEMLT